MKRIIVLSILCFGALLLTSCESKDSDLEVNNETSLLDLRFMDLKSNEVLVAIPSSISGDDILVTKANKDEIHNNLTSLGYKIPELNSKLIIAISRNSDEKVFSSAYSAAKYAGELMDAGKCVMAWKDKSGKYHVKSTPCEK